MNAAVAFEMEKRGFSAESNERGRGETKLVRLLVTSLPGPNGESAEAEITIWRPSPDMEACLVEGKCIMSIGLLAKGDGRWRKGSSLAFSNSRSTQFKAIADVPDIFRPREAMSLSQVSRLGHGSDCDIVGLVVAVYVHGSESRDSNRSKGSSGAGCGTAGAGERSIVGGDHVYITDGSGEVLELTFPEGIKQFGVDSFVETRIRSAGVDAAQYLPHG